MVYMAHASVTGTIYVPASAVDEYQTLGWYVVPGPEASRPSGFVPGAIQARTTNLDGWYNNLLKLKSRRLKVLVLGDSVSVLSNIDGFSWPWLVAKNLSQHSAGADQSALGTCYGVQSDLVPSVKQTVGATATDVLTGLGGYSATFPVGAQFTVTGLLDTVRLVYTKGSGAGKVKVYDGTTGGTLKTTVDCAGATSYSNVATVAMGTAAARTVTFQVIDNPVTVEAVLLDNSVVSGDAGVDMVVAAHSGWKTSHFLPTGDPDADGSSGDTSSHALTFAAGFQPDLIINAAGYNDPSVAAYKAQQEKLNAALLTAAPAASILTVCPYNGGGNGKPPVDMYNAAAANAAKHPGRIAVVSFEPTMGNVASTADPYDWAWDGAHPSGPAKQVQAALVTAAITGDPLGTALAQPAIVAQNPGIPWIGATTGAHKGAAARTVRTVTANDTILPADVGGVIYYAGASNITLTYPLATGLASVGREYAPITVIRAGAGNITITGSGGVTAVGTTATTTQWDVLDVYVSPELGTNILCKKR